MNLYDRIVTLTEQLCASWPRAYVLACLLIASGLGYLSFNLAAWAKGAFELISAFQGNESVIMLVAMMLLMIASLACVYQLVICLMNAYSTLRHLYAQRTEVSNDV